MSGVGDNGQEGGHGNIDANGPTADISDNENSLRAFDFRPGQLRALSYRNVNFPVKLLAVEK